MHHSPAGPPPSERARSALAGLLLALRGALPRPRWVVPVLLVALGVGGVAIAVPVASGAVGRAPVSLDASSATRAPHRQVESPVVMGVDGKPSAGGPSDVQTMAVAPGSRSADDPQTTSATTANDPTVTATTAQGTPPGTSTSTASSSSSSASSSSSSSSAAGSSAPPSPPAVPVLVPDAGDTVLAAVNDARTAQGCAPLTAGDALTEQAATNSTDMAAAGTLAVQDAAGSAAATLLQHGASDASAAVAAWLADPADSAHLLDCSLTTAGGAEATAASGPWWTLFLA